jgi:hypothetical protein
LESHILLVRQCPDLAERAANLPYLLGVYRIGRPAARGALEPLQLVLRES